MIPFLGHRKNESREDVGRTDSKVRPYSGAKDRFVGGDKCKSNLPLDDENLKEEENTSSINTDDCDPGRNLTLPDPEKNKESHSGTFPMGLTDSDLNHQPPDGMDKGNRAKGTKKLKRRKRKTKSGQTKMSKVHYTDHAMDILLKMSRMILKFVETRYGGQIIAGLIWFLLINNTTGK
ncbi:hypothetical protein GDO86_012151 [Hymenochirus boettgeri]|uniref:Uncharacterized protein n=1 Tax=Hymenochirus boettgeri TaxID=247094 RepID=A0A8T2IQ36_9PIPI|nr:hypothetical protein GDO86_012151 [Hymenochirus boettgeri]